MHPVTLVLTDLEWEALRGPHRDGLDLTDSRYIGLLLGRERARIIHEDESIRALRVALAEKRGENAQG